MAPIIVAPASGGNLCSAAQHGAGVQGSQCVQVRTQPTHSAGSVPLPLMLQDSELSGRAQVSVPTRPHGQNAHDPLPIQS